MRGFSLVFFKTGIRREKQLGKNFSDCNKTINKKKKR
jgi:hypothetical protein